MEYANDVTNGSDTLDAYMYLSQWEWPEHIESVLRKVVHTRLTEIGESDLEDGHELQASDYLGARLIWLITVYPKSNPTVLHSLAQQQQSAAYLERIAENPNTLPETLDILAQNRSSNVRVAVAENHNTSASTLQQLAHDESVDVRYAMAENVALTEEILDQLLQDDNAYVAARARRSVNKLAPSQPAIMPLRFNRPESVSRRRRTGQA
ncbi:MAG TPA: hypothetical protein V6C81_18885 [Planktothrix sp.]|jgi:hypothetical protein